MKFIKQNCLLCGRRLWPASTEYARAQGYQIHPNAANKANGCLVQFTDRFGVSVDEIELEPPEIIDDDADFLSELEGVRFYPTVESVMIKVFAGYGVPRLGGKSSGRGWSSYGLYQRCPYAWKRRYIDREDKPSSQITAAGKESPALAIGTIVHALLAIWYLRTITPGYPLTPEQLRDGLRKEADPVLVDEGWRVFYFYTLLYKLDPVQTLAVEYDIKNPRTGESCRYDLIGFYPEAIDGRPAGTYAFEHKTSGRFDTDFLEGWINDGEILGEVMLWQDLGLDKRFGPLQGIIMNLCGKQKEPQYHRTVVAPSALQLDQHRADLKTYEGLISLSRHANVWPRARNNCINRYGRCSEWEHCASGAP